MLERRVAREVESAGRGRREREEERRRLAMEEDWDEVEGEGEWVVEAGWLAFCASHFAVENLRVERGG